MPKDKARKKAARERAATTGEPYTLARRNTIKANAGVVLASDLQQSLADALRALGWPVRQQNLVEHGVYTAYAGNIEINVGRNSQLMSWSGDEDPDDDLLVDLAIPPDITVRYPYIEEDHGVFDLAVAADRPADILAADLNRQLGDARRTAVSKAVDDAECQICGDAYPAHQLMPTGDLADQEYTVCPACVFDQDTPTRLPVAAMTAWFDHYSSRDPALPAGWSAVAALLAVASPRPDTIPDLWHENFDAFHEPLEHWREPKNFWIWLPPGDQRPKFLNHLGVGARLGAIVDAVTAAFPNLQQELLDEMRENLTADGDSDEEADATVREWFTPALWPAAIAYAIAFATQASERPHQRAPWHFVESFEGWLLAELLEELDSPITYNAAHITLMMAEDIARKTGLL